ncbi:uncharacterized protein si:ch211-161h7.5 [Trichomycterus rosablanca]|uniref:uncharacterized protein si:ch211-161h7.5 n=1 Tax=Trichomycterus rosablanca TaxID=2290929 RepID=UPI002F350C7C
MRVMIAAFILLFLVAFTNYLMIFFSCHGLKEYGAWLNKYHRIDLWCIRILVQNGIAVYTTWTSIASLINFTITLSYDAGMNKTDAATLALSLLLVAVIAWFVLENTLLDRHVRYILTIYPVIIVALSGGMTKNFDASAPALNSVFTAVLLAIACVLLVVKVCLVIWRHLKQPIYGDTITPGMMLPMEIAEKQKRILM